MEFADIKVGVHVVLKEKYPCKVTQVNLSRPGKHGHAKKAVIGIDVITDKKYEEIYTHHTTGNKIPLKIERKPYKLNYSDDDGYMSLMDDNTEIREDLSLGEDDIARQIQKMMDADKEVIVTILEATIGDVTQSRIVAATSG